MDIPENWLDICIRLVSAVFLSGLIGLDREVRNKPAGLRTHMLVGLGAAGFCVFALELSAGPDNKQLFDPLRIISGVIGGLGFLGAGAIMQSGNNVYGLTTAAGIWIVGAVGVGCGTGNFFVVCVFTAIALICIVPCRYLERHINSVANSQNDGD